VFFDPQFEYRWPRLCNAATSHEVCRGRRSPNPSLQRPPSSDAVLRSNLFDSSSSTRVPTRMSSPSGNESDPSALSMPANRNRRVLGFSLNSADVDLGSIWAKTAPKRFRSPSMVANQIRRLRRHGYTTISQRHMISGARISDAEKETLKAMCKELLDFDHERVPIQ